MELSIALIIQQLQQEMGPDNFTIYRNLLRDWFGQRLTKSMFDYEVESCFQGKCYELHNLLLRSILLQCATGVGDTLPIQIPAQTSVQGPVGSSSITLHTGVNAVGYSTPQPEAQRQGQEDSNSRMCIAAVPGLEEPNAYPPPTNEYQVQQVVEVPGSMDWLEPEPPSDCDWLKQVEMTYYDGDACAKMPYLKNRFPPWMAHEVQRVNLSSYTYEVNSVRNVTNINITLKDIIERKPHLKQHFVVPTDNKLPYLSSGCSLYGRILVKAWDHNVQNVNLLVTECAVNAVRAHIKEVLIAIIQQRRPFRMRDKRVLHSMGVPYPNPYLRQGFHMYDEAYSTDTTKMADVVMQVPAPVSTIEEKERLAALQVAACYPSKESRFISSKGTMMDFLLAIERNPALIPFTKSRFKLWDTLLRNCKGFAGSQNAQYYDYSNEDHDASLQPAPLLPLASY